jgi:hypothetical protein
MGAPGFGQAYKDAVKNGQWTMKLVGFGECLPYKHNRVTLNKNVTDVFGIPVLHIDIGVGREREEDDPRHGGERRRDARGVRREERQHVRA